MACSERVNKYERDFTMKKLIQSEEVMIVALSIYLFSLLNQPWWLFLVLLLVPDIFMLGYIIDTKIGAIIYNIGHHRGISVAIFLLGMVLQLNVVSLIGVILFAHSSMDRIFGYGLKFSDAFTHTHMDNI